MVVPKLAIASIFAALVSGCSVGEVPGGGGTPDAGMGNGMGGGQTFESRVKPLVTRCVSCHQGVQPPNLSSFAALEAKYKTKPGANNILVTKGDHQGTTFLSTAERQSVAAWIDSL